MAKWLGLAVLCVPAMCEVVAVEPTGTVATVESASISEAVTDSPAAASADTPTNDETQDQQASVLISSPISLDSSISGKSYSLKLSNWSLADSQHLSKFQLLQAQLSGPPLPPQFVVMWYFQLAEPGLGHNELETFTFETEVSGNQIAAMEVTNY